MTWKRCLLVFASSNAAIAWGPDGHSIVAHIAEHFLNPEADAALKADLGNVSLTDAADWNDDFDHTPEGRWSEPLHFINYPGHACAFDWARDCDKDKCNPGAIVNYTRQIFDTSKTSDERLVALKFLIHMMGDLHQPLHVASSDDLGGNLIKVAGNEFSSNSSHWVRETEALHKQWDTDIVLQAIYDQEFPETSGTLQAGYPVHYHDWHLLSDYLDKQITGEWKDNMTVWQEAIADPRNEADFRTGLAKVANETAALGCQYAYTYANGDRVQSGDMMKRDYYLRAKPVVLTQLARGGVRLAQALNDAFESLGNKKAATPAIMI